jgi:hypothetical protein
MITESPPPTGTPLFGQTGHSSHCLPAFLVDLFIVDIDDSVLINSLGLCFLAVVVSFEVYFIAENVRGFMLLYEVETTGFLGCNTTSLRKWSLTFQRNESHSPSVVQGPSFRFACFVNTAVTHGPCDGSSSL